MTLVSLSPPASEVTRWREVHKSTPALVALADRHYTRQTPGSPQCCRPGVNLCLLTDDCSARTEDPDTIYSVNGDPVSQVFLFPDAGCC